MEHKWEGSVTSSKLHGVSQAQAWALVGDYYNLHKYFPSTVLSCGKLNAHDDGRPGSYRYSTVALPGSAQVHWAKDRLMSMDSEGMSYTYEVGDNSMGFGEMVVALKVVPADRDSCKIEWSYTGEPARGWTHAKFSNLLKTGADEVARIVGDTIRATH